MHLKGFVEPLERNRQTRGHDSKCREKFAQMRFQSLSEKFKVDL